VTVLSGGEKRRVALCKLLLQQPDLLLLDEPTNHLDAESVQWLEQHLEKYPGTVVAITHDRYFLDNVAQWILEIDRAAAYPYEGNYSTYLETKAGRLKIEGQKDAKLRKRRLTDELEWVRSNPKARQAKSPSRLQRYEEMAAEAERTRKLDFEEIQIPPGPRLGNVVVVAEPPDEGLRRPGADRRPELLAAPQRHRRCHRAQRRRQDHAVQDDRPRRRGPSDEDAWMLGTTSSVGDTVRCPTSTSPVPGLDATKNVWEVVSDGLDYIKVGNVEMPSRAYVSAFGFKGPDQQKQAKVLSGGERNRLNLALTLKMGGNVLLLDEPTNDLDVETSGASRTPCWSSRAAP
jgi:ATPase subunit of ABC transporter with duplicated ATPase domains